jgi:hypothetical protein
MWLALKLWAANRLLMEGWEIGGGEALGMCRVPDVTSSLFDSIPAPRVLQNQLERILESYIARAEVEFLKELQNAMLRKRRENWIVVFMAVVITLHVREGYLEIGILGFEPRNSKLSSDVRSLLMILKAYQWRHPDTAAALIKRSVHLSNLLLTHLHVCRQVPREFYNIEKAVIEQHIERAYCRYNWMDERSIDFSLCSLAFDTSDSKLLKLAKSADFGC